VSGFIFLALAAVALIAWVYFRGREKAGALPQGTLTYSDTDGQRVHETLVSHRYGLIGRPDYVIQTAKDATPVEVKSRSCGRRGPYPGEKAQLFAYCLLIEDVMGRVCARASSSLPIENGRWLLGRRNAGKFWAFSARCRICKARPMCREATAMRANAGVAGFARRAFAARRSRESGASTWGRGRGATTPKSETDQRSSRRSDHSLITRYGKSVAAKRPG